MNTLRADFYRGFRSKSTYVSLGILIASVAFVASIFLAAFSMLENEEVQSGAVITAGDTDTADLSQQEDMEGTGNMDGRVMAEQFSSGTMGTGVVQFFIIPFIILFLGLDFSSQTINNVLSRGHSRTRYYLLKFIPITAAAIIIQLLTVIVPTVIAGIVRGFGSGYTVDWFLSVLRVNVVEMLLLTAMVSVGMMFAVITKKTAAVVGLFIAFSLVPELLLELAAQAFPGLEKISLYTISGSMSISVASAPEDLLRSTLVAVGYIVVTTAIGLAVIKKSDIK